MRPGMRLGEALATCPQLVLVERDPAGVEQSGSVSGASRTTASRSSPSSPAALLRHARGRAALRRRRAGAQARARARSAPPGTPAPAPPTAASPRSPQPRSPVRARHWSSTTTARGSSSRRSRSHSFPLEGARREELEHLGVKKIGQLAGLPGSAVAERLGPDGRRAWSLARNEGDAGGEAAAAGGGDRRAARVPRGGRRTSSPSAAHSTALLDRILARPERGGREIRKVALSARLVGGGSWRRTLTLREPSAERGILRAALGPKLAELPAPVLSLGIELLSLSESPRAASSR